MHAKSIEIPRYIIFSGTGSKTLSITDGSADFNKLQKLTKIIFSKVYSTDNVGKIELQQDKKPKEVSCKGALMIDTDIDDVDDIKTVLLGTEENIIIPEKNITYTKVNDLDILNGIKKEVENFVEILFDIHKEFNFTKNFGVNASKLSEYQAILKEDTMQYLKSGIERKLDELNGNLDIDIEESLFFYPLVGALNKLAYKNSIKEKTVI
jgi:hypothetical protein